MRILNLDKIAQEKAIQILNASDKETLERLVTKALGVLQAQGVYAMMLFLFSRTSKENEVAPHIRKPLYKALEELHKFKNDEELKSFIQNESPKEVLRWFAENVTSNLDTLLLVRELFEQTLIYARFHAKAEKEAKIT